VHGFDDLRERPREDLRVLRPAERERDRAQAERLALLADDRLEEADDPALDRLRLRLALLRRDVEEAEDAERVRELGPDLVRERVALLGRHLEAVVLRRG